MVLGYPSTATNCIWWCSGWHIIVKLILIIVLLAVFMQLCFFVGTNAPVPLLPSSNWYCNVSSKQQSPILGLQQKPHAPVLLSRLACVAVNRWSTSVSLHKGISTHTAIVLFITWEQEFWVLKCQRKILPTSQHALFYHKKIWWPLLHRWNFVPQQFYKIVWDVD